VEEVEIKNMKMNYKKLSVGLLAIILIIGSYFGYVWSITPTTTFYLSSGIYPSAATYTIWTDGTNYFAKDAYGLIAYSGTDASTVINAALAATGYPHQGGIVYVKSGFYSLTSTLIIPSWTTLQGEGWVDRKSVV
jgi:hypothetical protein